MIPLTTSDLAQSFPAVGAVRMVPEGSQVSRDDAEHFSLAGGLKDCHAFLIHLEILKMY